MHVSKPWAALGLTLVSVACGRPSSEQTGSDLTPALDLHGDLTPGKHAVGFRKERLELRPATAAPSALDLYLWYPAGSAEAAGAPLPFGDYYRAQEPTEPAAEELREWLLADMTEPPGVEAGDLERVLQAPMWARTDIDPAAGAHPLVLWSYRDSVPTMQAVLNEYLASHGYVVAFAWPIDHAPPLPWQGELTAEDRRRSLERQIDLLEATFDSLAGRPWIDAGRSAVLAWSYGGESATGLQRRRSEIRLALGIDAILVSGWIFQTAEDLAALDRGELDAPYALLKNGRSRIAAERAPEPPLLAEIPAGAWYVRFPALSHGNFNFPGGMLPGVLDLPEVSEWAVGGAAAKLGYELVCRHALGLLDHHVRGVESAPAAWSAGAPESFVEVVRHEPRP